MGSNYVINNQTSVKFVNKMCRMTNERHTEIQETNINYNMKFPKNKFGINNPILSKFKHKLYFNGFCNGISIWQTGEQCTEMFSMF